MLAPEIYSTKFSVAFSRCKVRVRLTQEFLNSSAQANWHVPASMANAAVARKEIAENSMGTSFSDVKKLLQH